MSALAACTHALRSKDPASLRAGLLRMLMEGGSQWSLDPRDLMVGLAPFHDCARRLGLHPAAFFADVAAQSRPSVAQLVREFGARTDVTPSSFGFVVRETPEGPEYAWNVDAP